MDLAEIVSRFRADVSGRNDSWFTVGRRPEYYYLDILRVGNSFNRLESNALSRPQRVW